MPEELKLAEAYLDIEKMRLDGRLEVRWKTQPGTGHQLVPQLILQPLIENAIVHGIACSRDGGWLRLGCGVCMIGSNCACATAFEVKANRG